MKKTKKLSKSAYDHAYKSKDRGNVAKQDWIDWSKCIKGDRKIKFFKPIEDVNMINIIPFEIKSKNHPLVRSGKMNVGDLDFQLDMEIHRYVGPSNADIICPKRNYGKRCPICEEREKYYAEGKNNEAKKLKPTRRILLNVQPIIEDKPSKELMVFHVSHYLFMRELIDEAHSYKEKDEIVQFADIEKGKIIRFRGSEEDIEDNKMMKFKSFGFLPREEEITEEILDQTISFDEGLVLLSYEEIEKIFYGQDEEEEEENTDREERKKEEEEEEKKESKVKKEKDNKCPFDHKFGEADDHDNDCPKCKIWDDCITEQHKIRKRRRLEDEAK